MDIRYKVYELTEGGTLRVPKKMEWGHSSPVYDSGGYTTMEEAATAIEKQCGYNLFILAVITPSYWDG